MDYNKALALYKEALAKNPNFELKGKTMPYTSSNGHMFSQLNKDGEVGIRLSKKDTEVFDTEHGVAPFKSYGAVMREYVLIPEHVVQDTEKLANYLQQGHQYVLTLKPK